MRAKTILRALAAMLLIPASLAVAASTQTDPQLQPFRIVGNLYYVGGANGAYLISTPKGLILINSNYPDSPPLIRQSVEKLGFKWSDIRILLISHTHIDHAGGSAQIVRETGARYEVMDGDVDVAESGGRTDFQHGGEADQLYPPAHVDRVLHDGDTVALGGVTLTAHLTAGHTKGVTTWTVDEREGDRTLHVVILGGWTLGRGVALIGNARYPAIAADYAKGFAIMHALPCDIPLGAHDFYFGLKDKYKRFVSGDKNAFVDPGGCRTFIDKAQAAFDAELSKQQTETAQGKPIGN